MVFGNVRVNHFDILELDPRLMLDVRGCVYCQRTLGLKKCEWDRICKMRVSSAKSSMGIVEKFIFKIKSPCQQESAEIILRKVSRTVIE